jgi:hypothetical protein
VFWSPKYGELGSKTKTSNDAFWSKDTRFN